MSNSKNAWHQTMYDTNFAIYSIGSKRFTDLAKTQVAFLSKILNLESGAKILDVPCGTGRHSMLFAKLGYRVTGVDISRDCLKIAKRRASHKNAKYLTGDMSRLKNFSGHFDAVLNLFTSFGYFYTDKENEHVLREMCRALKPGGKLVLNLIDRDWILKIYQPARWVEENGIMTLEASKFDPKTKYNESQMVMIDKRGRKPKMLHNHYHRVRLYSKNEVVMLMKKVGLKDITVYGGFNGGKYSKGRSTHPIYVGQRP